ncbi:MAG: hypothetical protein HY706_15080 [Candidatus Hydrogenedentes bacterium]|nr:hypothetical protein [Candidatus Hydrogenedentota bacterium]
MSQSNAVEVIAQVGRFDRSPNEFALAPDGANQFKERFANGVRFVVGKDDASSFPFIHPSAADTAWGSAAEHPFRIVFAHPATPTGNYALVLALFDQHELLASELRVEVNGHEIATRKMPLGSGRAFFGPCAGAPKTLLVPIPSDAMIAGENEMTLTLLRGSWIAYDALAVVRYAFADLEAGRRELMPDEAEARATDFVGENALLDTFPGGFRCLGSVDGAVRLALPDRVSPSKLEFDLLLAQGDVRTVLEIPDDRARGDYVGLAFGLDRLPELESSPLSKTVLPVDEQAAERPKPGTQYHVRLEYGRDSAAVSVTDLQGRAVLEAALVHVAGPTPRMAFQCCSEPFTAFSIANFRSSPASSQKAPRPAVLPRASVKQPLRVSNGTLELTLDVGTPTMGPLLLRNAINDTDYADLPYLYRVNEDDSPPQLERYEHQVVDGAPTLILHGRKGDWGIEHRFTFSSDWLEENLQIINHGNAPVDTSKLAFGFVKQLGAPGAPWALKDSRLVPIPYRRDTCSPAGAYEDIPFSELTWRRGYFRELWNNAAPSPIFGSEGWSWLTRDAGLTWIKYNPDAMEFSLVEPFWMGDQYVFRFGGCGLWKLGDPEPARQLAPGASFTFGTTYYTTRANRRRGAYAAFRDFMDAKGHRFPNNYNPPVHWNELYDNPLWWGPDTPERRAQHYRLEDIVLEAEKAAELGCESLYLDPGWDTSFASTLWSDGRLAKNQREFVNLLKNRYHMVLALHCPLAAWSDVNAYPVEARRMDEQGKVLEGLCGASSAYLNTKAQRLIKLCDDGAAFLMYDGTWYPGPCYDSRHGHSIPLTRHEHVMAYRELLARVKRAHPEVLIELHDPILGGVVARYSPTYFLHALPDSFDELWGFEYMWDPMDDLISGRAISLYYVNLAYNIPIYLHIDLRKDNEHALEFWWYASTCRHLGIGGKHSDPKVWTAHKAAMREYLARKAFYTRGAFYGLDETVHAHTLAEEGRCVLNVFNLGDVAVERQIRFRLGDVGLQPGSDTVVAVRGAEASVRGEDVTIWVNLPARGHTLVEIGP